MNANGLRAGQGTTAREDRFYHLQPLYLFVPLTPEKICSLIGCRADAWFAEIQRPS